jgi:methyl-accepting chemotaxis protein
MTLEDEINAALGAHGLWKLKLRDAIRSGRSDDAPAVLRQDMQCRFGQWLRGPALPPAAKGTPHYDECVDLHARFHAAAAHVLELALTGRKAEAEAALGPGGDFARLSAQLARAMTRWQRIAA